MKTVLLAVLTVCAIVTTIALAHVANAITEGTGIILEISQGAM